MRLWFVRDIMALYKCVLIDWKSCECISVQFCRGVGPTDKLTRFWLWRGGDFFVWIRDHYREFFTTRRYGVDGRYAVYLSKLWTNFAELLSRVDQDDLVCDLDPGFLNPDLGLLEWKLVEEQTFIRSVVLARWQHWARRKFEVFSYCFISVKCPQSVLNIC